MNFGEKDIKNYADFLNHLTPNELAVIASLVGIYLSQGLTANQQNAIGNFLEAIGQIIQCIGAQQQNLEENKTKYPKKPKM